MNHARSGLTAGFQYLVSTQAPLVSDNVRPKASKMPTDRLPAPGKIGSMRRNSKVGYPQAKGPGLPT